MKMKYKVLFILCFILIFLGIFVGCNSSDSPYDVNNEKGYTVSVKYDANGGFFTTNTSVIVDSYNIDEIKKNNKGMAEIALLPPDDPARETDAFTATNNGYFLAGWYQDRIENKDAEGNAYYTYSNKWDFDNQLLEVDPDKEYSADKPFITLYAAWIPLFKIEFYDISTNELIKDVTFNPNEGQTFTLPYWSTETGKLETEIFPSKAGYTFDRAYMDADCKNELSGTELVHPGIVDYKSGTAVDSVFKIYLSWLEGDWYHIYTADQFIDNVNVTGHYVIHDDLDFTGKIWPTAMLHGNFTGAIYGNGHAFSNISLIQTNNAKANSGLFGQLSDGAVVENLSFKNVEFTIKGGTRVVGSNFGLFAGSISSNAEVSDVVIEDGKIIIDSQCYFGVDDYSIGLLCGMGDSSVIDFSDIHCVAGGENPDKVQIDISGNQVSVVIS